MLDYLLDQVVEISTTPRTWTDLLRGRRAAPQDGPGLQEAHGGRRPARRRSPRPTQGFKEGARAWEIEYAKAMTRRRGSAASREEAPNARSPMTDDFLLSSCRRRAAPGRRPSRTSSGGFPELRSASRTRRGAARQRGGRPRLPLRRSRDVQRAPRGARFSSGPRSTATCTARRWPRSAGQGRRLRRDDLRHRLPGGAPDPSEGRRRDRHLHPASVDDGARAASARPRERDGRGRAQPLRRRQARDRALRASSTTSS